MSFEIDGTVGEDKYLEDFSLGCFLYENIYRGNKFREDRDAYSLTMYIDIYTHMNLYVVQLILL